MIFDHHIPLIKFILSIATPVMYILTFAKESWVEGDNFQWGMWAWCYTNFTDDVDTKDLVNDTEKCHSIAPGDSPGYYEAVRTIACFALVAFLGYFGTFNDREGLGKENRPVLVALLASTLASILLMVLGSCFREDERWMHLNPRLGWCFWLALADIIIGFFMCFVFWRYTKLRCTNAPTPTTNTPSTTSASAVNTEQHDVSRDPGARNVGVSVQSQTEPPPYAEYPILNVPGEAVSSSLSPPPSYEEAIRGSTQASSPPPQPFLVSYGKRSK